MAAVDGIGTSMGIHDCSESAHCSNDAHRAETIRFRYKNTKADDARLDTVRIQYSQFSSAVSFMDPMRKPAAGSEVLRRMACDWHCTACSNNPARTEAWLDTLKSSVYLYL